MKKALVCLLLAAVCFAACSCALIRSSSYTVAIITGPAGVSDRSAAQGVYRGLNAYCESHGVSLKEYTASADTTESVAAQIKDAAKHGAKLMVFAGENMGAYADIAAEEYSFDVLTFDCETQEKNMRTHSVLFSVEQAAFMAGYAAAAEGYTSLGFVGGKRTPKTVTYFNAFVRGADWYAAENGATDITLRCWFSDQSAPSKELEDAALSIFNGGVQIICVCGDGIYRSLNYAANVAKKPLIGCGLNQAGFSERYITTAASEYQLAAENALESYFKSGGWDAQHAGVTQVLDIHTDMVGLPNDFGSYRLKNFTKDSYETFYARIKYGTLGIDISATYPLHTGITVTVMPDGLQTENK